MDSLRGAQGRPWTGGCKKTQRGRIGGVSKVGGWTLLEEPRGDLGQGCVSKVGGWTLLEEHRGDLGQGGVKKQRGRIGGVSKVGGWILLGEHRGDLGHRVGEGSVWGWVRVGGLCPPPTPHALASTPERHHTRSAPSPEARGPPLGGSMRPCAAACLRGHTTWLGGVAAWFDGGFPWCRAGARSHTFRVAGGRFGDPAPSTVWLRKALRLARTHCAHPLARRPRVLVARQHAVSEPTSLTCGTWTGKRLPDHTLGPPHGARALVVHARARRVGRGGE